MTQQQFTIDYFLRRVSDIPDEYMGISTELNPTDIWEWLEDDEQDALYEMIKPFGILIQVNDGEDEWGNFGKTPKERVLKFLLFVKKSREELMVS